MSETDLSCVEESIFYPIEKIRKPWYTATMNDCIFIVDKKPSPSNEYMRFGGNDDVMVISMRSGSREVQQIAEQIVAAHNASL